MDSSNKGAAANKPSILQTSNLRNVTQQVFYNLLYSMVKNNDLPMKAAVFLTILEDIQLFSFAWDPQFGFGSAIPGWVVAFFAPINSMVSLSYFGFVITFCFVFILITTAVLFIVVCGIFFHKGRFTAIWPLHVLRGLTTFITTVMLLSLLEFLTAAIACTHVDENGNSGYLTMFPEIHCFRSSHIVVFVLTIVTLAVFMPFVITIVLVYIDPMPFPRGHDEWNALSRAHGRIDFVYVLIRIALAFLFAFTGTSLQVIKQSIACVLFGCLTILYINYQPLYMPLMNQLRSGFLAATTVSCFIAAVTSSIPNVNGTAAFIALCCSTLPSFAAGFFLAEYYQRRLREGIYQRIRKKFQAKKIIEISSLQGDQLGEKEMIAVASAKREREIKVNISFAMIMD